MQGPGAGVSSGESNNPPKPTAPTLSVVLPIYDERDSLDRVLSAVSAELDKTRLGYEIICVDDGSTDGSDEALQRARLAWPTLRVVHLSRNFGKDAALSAGLGVALGDAVIIMDADLQHPPELIPLLVEKWRQGYQVVSGVKSDRGQETWAYRAMATVFNQLMGGAAGARFHGASDFKLLDREVVEVIAELPEKTRFFRGLVAWVGFRTTELPFEVAARVAGNTKWSTRGLIKYSLRNLLAFSAFPLQLMAAVGFSTLLFAGVLACWTLYRWLRGDAVTGFTTVILLQLILGGLLLSGVGVIALYLGAIYDEVKARPAYIVRRRSRREDAAPPRSPLEP